MLIDIQRLTALRHIAPKSDVRYYLNGVHVQYNSEKDADNLTFTATDGNMLGRFTDTALDDSGEKYSGESFELIVPLETLAAIKVGARHPGTAILTGTGDDWVITDGNTSHRFTPIDGKFPNADIVIPTGEPSNEPAPFNFELLANFTKVSKAMRVPRPGCFQIEYNGMASARVTHYKLPDFIGVVMPFRA